MNATAAKVTDNDTLDMRTTMSTDKISKLTKLYLGSTYIVLPIQGHLVRVQPWVTESGGEIPFLDTLVKKKVMEVKTSVY